MDLLLPHHRLPLLLAVLVAASHAVPSSGDDGVGYDDSLCVRQAYTCGSVSIRYPFYSRTGALLENASSSSYCGYPGLEIQCEDGKAFLELESGNYTVSSIDYENLTVQLVDPEVVDGRSCPWTDHNVTFRSFEWFYYPNTTVVDLLFFLNCNFLSSDLTRPSNSSSTACKFDGGGQQPWLGMSFVFLEQDVPFRETNWWRHCSVVIEVPVLRFGLPLDPQNDSTWKDGGYSSSLRDGFQLALNQSQKLPACDQCERSKGQCGYNQTGGFMACLCSGGRVSAANNCTAEPSGKPLYKLLCCFSKFSGDCWLFCSKFIVPSLFSLSINRSPFLSMI